MKLEESQTFQKEIKIIDVQTGEVNTGTKGTILRSSAIGSCVVVAAYDLKAQIGGLAHIMLPGKAPENTNYQKTRYANDAIEDLINKINLNGAEDNNIEVCLIGGANVLNRENDSIARDNINSVFEILKKRKLLIREKSLSGMERRSALLNIETGCLNYTIGDGAEMILWNFVD
jgi:chemotaxis protein CheD